MEYRLLLAEDDPDVSRLLTRALRREGCDVAVHANIDAVLAGLTNEPDMIIVDMGSADPDAGLRTCWRLRDAGNTVPVLLLMDRTACIDLVVARESGADDCLAKPFRFAELLDRIHALAPPPSPGPDG